MGFLRKFFRKYLWIPLLYFFLKNKLSGFHVFNSLETLSYLLKHDKCSLVRFGDGEIEILMKTGNPDYQEASEALRIKLEYVLKSDLKNLLVCVPAGLINYANRSIYNEEAKIHFRNILVRFHKYLSNVLSKHQIYGDAHVSRPYIDTLNKDFSRKIFDGFKQLFSVKTLIVIEGEKTRLGVGNDLLAGAQHVLRVIAPAVNAFDKYEEILEKAKEVAQSRIASGDKPEDIMFVLALGSTAKPLTLDLTNLGYRSIDAGHLDIEYEWFLRNANQKISIPGKYVNEAKDGKVWRENTDLNLDQYESEIVAKV